ncbi:MAG: transcriptional regulator, GntR family with sensor domain protein [Pseudonocardiales bacterium]|nr:transcriptional regulator, GntR family with sensor domain protein [Pseudonocardiales bacterium]
MPVDRRRAVGGRSADARRIRDLLRSQVNAGGFDGGKLPTEDRLIDEFGASRAAVREALALLREEGLIERIKGIGTIALHSKIVVRLTENHGVVEPAPGSMWSGQMRVRVLDWCEVPLPTIAARRLDAAAGDRSLRIDYVAMLDGSPLGVATNYMRWPEGAALHPSHFHTDWYAMLEAAGVPVSETTFLWEASVADAQDATLLDIPVGSPVMLGEQVIYGPDGCAYDFALTRARGDRTAMFSHARRKPA